MRLEVDDLCLELVGIAWNCTDCLGEILGEVFCDDVIGLNETLGLSGDDAQLEEADELLFSLSISDVSLLVGELMSGVLTQDLNDSCLLLA